MKSFLSSLRKLDSSAHVLRDQTASNQQVQLCASLSQASRAIAKPAHKSIPGISLSLCTSLLTISASVGIGITFNPERTLAAACAGVYSTRNGAAGSGTGIISYYNTITNSYVDIFTYSGGENINAIATQPSTGNLFFVNRATGKIIVYNVNTGNQATLAGTLPGTTTGIIGATFDATGKLYVYYTNKTLVEVNPSTGSQVNSTINISGIPGNNNTNRPTNGDIAIGTNGTLYAIGDTSGTTTANITSQLYSITISGSTATATPVNNNTLISGVNTVNGIAIDPLTGKFYLSASTGTYELNTTTKVATQLTSTAGVNDLSACGSPAPDLPSITKAFSPNNVVGIPANSTLTLTLGNTNTVPIYLISTLIDNLQTGLAVRSPNGLGGTCLNDTANSNKVTAVANSTSISLLDGLKVPAGGCTVTVDVTASTANTFTNTITNGSLQTTAGNNLNATTSTLVVIGTDYGDAPITGTAPNGTSTNAYGEARHGVVAGIKLGAAIDSETASIANATASGDGVDDDGISSFPTLTAGATSYSIPASNVTATGTGTLHAWIDFNKNGTFDTGEYASVAVTNNVLAGNLNWTGITAGAAGNTYARFRFTTDTTITQSTPSGLASDGEVEDYQIAIAAPTYTVTGNVFDDADGSKVKAASGENYTAADITAVLLNGSNQVVSSAVVNATTGDYTLSNVPAGSYSVKIIKKPTTALTVGAVIPPANDILPTNWVATGENNNGTPDATVDRTQTVTVASANIANLNFGIEQRPTAVGGTASSQVNPGTLTTVPTNLFTGSTDPDGTVASYKITAFPSNASSIEINSTLYTSLTFPGIGVTVTAAQLSTIKVSPNVGTVTVGIPFQAIDNAGQSSSNTALANLPFTAPGVEIYDYGDAPDTGTGTGTGNYQTTALDGGAAQVMINAVGQVLSLGSNIDTDNGSLQNTTALADDTSGTTPDDEDGVNSFPTLTTTANQTYTVPVTVQNNVPLLNTYLVGYIDFNKDGDFNDTGEKSATVTVPTSSTNPRTFNVTFTTPAGMTTGNTYARFRLGSVQATAESATGASAGTDNGEIEDYQIAIAQPVASDPKLLLVKRITAINPGQANSIQFNNFVNDGSPTDDEAPNWPDSDSNPSNNINTYLRGAINVPGVKPGDEVEYTIYFLSTGDVAAKNIQICDVVPDNMTFNKNSYGAELGIGLALNATDPATITYLSNFINNDPSDDGDGNFYPPGTDPLTSLCQKHDPSDTDNLIPHTLIPVNSSNNLSGVVLIKLNTPLPPATAPGTPPNSYGFIRFRAKVK